jgi:hypothetical protein
MPKTRLSPGRADRADLRELGLPLGPRKITLKAMALAGPPTTDMLPEADARGSWVEDGCDLG